MIEFLFLDLDDTILDFHKAEKIAITKTLGEFGLTVNDEILATYSAINKAHWERLERGELTREEVLTQRFAVTFRHFGMEVDCVACARAYEKNLSVGHYFLPGAEEAVDILSKQYRLFLASNGTASVQKGRLTSANLYRFFEKVFVSQEIGYNKPAREYFEGCFAQIPGFDPKKAMIVGDSLTSDILGGINAGMATCWVNSTGMPGRDDIQPDYEIQSLAQLPEKLKVWNC